MEAMELPRRERLALAGFLLGSADEIAGQDAAMAWDAEIRARLAAVEEGTATGVSYEEIMREAGELLKR